MYSFVVTLHITLCLLLIVLVLMQPGKGADISSAFGGGAASQLFGAAGPGNFLTRGTGVIAGLFMVTSIALVLYSTPDGVDVGGDVGEEGGGFGNSAKPVDDDAGGLPPLPPPDGAEIPADPPGAIPGAAPAGDAGGAAVPGAPAAPAAPGAAPAAPGAAPAAPAAPAPAGNP